jgi:hypothetical protein
VRLFLVLSILFFSTAASGWAQEAPANQEEPPRPSMELSREFYGLNLQDGLDAVKDGLKAHPYFLYRGDPDVSFLPQTTRTVIDCEGRYYVRRGLFQFSGERLYIITLYFNPERLDYFSLFTALTKKYGRPVSLDPSAAVWQDGRTRLSLEKPLTVKFIDQEAFDKLKAEGKTQKSIEEQSRRKFLDSF